MTPSLGSPAKAAKPVKAVPREKKDGFAEGAAAVAATPSMRRSNGKQPGPLATRPRPRAGADGSAPSRGSSGVTEAAFETRLALQRVQLQRQCRIEQAAQIAAFLKTLGAEADAETLQDYGQSDWDRVTGASDAEETDAEDAGDAVDPATGTDEEEQGGSGE